MSRWFIYVLRDPQTRAVRYVGKSTDPERRAKAHRYTSVKHRYHTARWINSLLQLGLEPIVETIDAGNGDGHASAERAWIAEYRRRGADLTNTAPGGEGRSGPHSPETIEKIRRAHLGKTLSPEHRAKLSEVRRGKKLSPEAIENSRRARTGLKFSPEACANIGASKRGLKLSDEHRRKISEAGKGRVPSAETREKIAASKRGKPRPDVAVRMRGRVVSEETLTRIRAAQQARRVREKAAREGNS